MDGGADPVDGRFGEAWAGTVPNGSHVNLVLARRGSPTAAAAASAFAAPGPGHAPVMACLGAGNAVRPATIVLNKATIASKLHGLITWGAAQLGIAAGIMDCVAEGILTEDDAAELVVLVAVWVDPGAHDETAVRIANREAVRKAIGVCVEGRDQAAAAALVERRDRLQSPFYSGD